MISAQSAPAVPPAPPEARTPKRLWLVGLAITTLCSWARYLATGSLRVDGNYPSAMTGALLLLALVVGYGAMVLGWRQLLAQPPANPRRLAFTGLAIASAMLPMLSNDLFSFLAYDSLAAHGKDVYTSTAALPESVWFSWIGERWTDTVCVSGPLALLLGRPAALAGGHPWLAIAMLRATWLLPTIAALELSLRRLRDRPFFHAMVWLNPLFLLEGAGQLHVDLLALVAVVAGIAFLLEGRLKSSWIAYVLATLAKISFAATGLWFWLAGAESRAQRIRRLPAMAAVAAPLAVAIFFPFWHGPATFSEPLRALSQMNPGGSLTEAVGDLVHVVRTLLSPDVTLSHVTAFNRAEDGGSWLVASLCFRLVALGVGLRTLLAMLRSPGEPKVIALGTGIVVVAIVTLAGHRFEPWYLLAALPFFGLQCPEVWRRWWGAAAGLAVAPTFINVLPPSTPLLPIWSVVCMVGVVTLFLVSFRARFLGPLSLASETNAR